MGVNDGMAASFLQAELCWGAVGCTGQRCDLSGRVRLLVTGQDLEHDAAAGLLQHLLQHLGVVANLFTVDLFDNVPHVQKALLVDHPAVEDPSDHQLAALHTKRYALNAHRGRTLTKEHL